MSLRISSAAIALLCVAVLFSIFCPSQHCSAEPEGDINVRLGKECSLLILNIPKIYKVFSEPGSNICQFEAFLPDLSPRYNPPSPDGSEGKVDPARESSEKEHKWLFITLVNSDEDAEKGFRDLKAFYVREFKHLTSMKEDVFNIYESLPERPSTPDNISYNMSRQLIYIPSANESYFVECNGEAVSGGMCSIEFMLTKSAHVSVAMSLANLDNSEIIQDKVVKFLRGIITYN